MTNTIQKPDIQTVVFPLPAYWASYLINGDASGISDEDKAACDKFTQENELGHCLTCSDESWFSWHNAATELGGDIMEFTFIL